MSAKVRRPRPPEKAIYKPPNARSDAERRKFEQIVDFEEVSSSLCEALTTKLGVIDQKSKPKGKHTNGKGNKTATKTPSGGRREPASKNIIEPTPDKDAALEEIEETVNIELSQRIHGTEEDVLRIAEIIKSKKTDCFIVARRGKTLGSYVELLKLMGPYFACTLQEGWAETRRGVIQTKIRPDYLEPIINFIHTGQIKLTRRNIGHIFVAAEYLQIECLMEACREFVSKRLDVLLDTAITLGTNHVGMTSVAELALDYVCEHFSESRGKLVKLTPEMIMMVLSRDELNVRSEDEVCDLVVEWLRTKQDPEAIKLMIECVRLPHLTTKAFRRLCEALEDGPAVPLIETVQTDGLANLPEDQLARRLYYDRHIHSIWRESRTTFVPKFFHLDENLIYRFECVRARDGKVMSTDVIQHFPEFRQSRTRFEFVTIMNSLFMITHSKRYDFILIYEQQRNGRWAQRIKYKRQSALSDLASSVHGTDLHLCMFKDFNEPMRTLHFQPLSFRDAEVVDYEPPIPLTFSPPRMIFREDFVIYMLESKIEILNRKTGQRGTIKIQSPDGPKLTKIKFTDIMVYEDKLYAYEEPPLSLLDDQSRLINDRLYVICLKEMVIESIVDIHFPKFRARRVNVIEGESYRSARMSIVGSRLVLHKYFSSHDCCVIVEYDPEKNVFNKVAEMPCSDQATYYKKLVSLVPLHVHPCEHETVLQRYCHSLRDPAQAAELDKLLFYL